MPQLEPATLTYVVTDDDTAAAVGSGSLPVLGTPRLLAWLEAATCACVAPVLPDGSTSVGTRVQVEHLAASPVGAEVEVSASSAYEDGRLHRFTVSARDTTSGKVLAAGRSRGSWSTPSGSCRGSEAAAPALRARGAPGPGNRRRRPRRAGRG